MILADEPTGNLDEKTGKEIMDLIFNLHRQKKNTLVIVTHNQALCDRVDVVYELTPEGLHKKS
jgi:putative ABC transport system ATP-binding protein